LTSQAGQSKNVIVPSPVQDLTIYGPMIAPMLAVAMLYEVMVNMLFFIIIMAVALLIIKLKQLKNIGGTVRLNMP